MEIAVVYVSSGFNILYVKNRDSLDEIWIVMSLGRGRGGSFDRSHPPHATHKTKAACTPSNA